MRFVLTAALDLAAMAALLDTVLPRDWRGVIIDREGRIVARSSDGAASAGRLAARSARQATEAGRGGEFRRGASREGTQYAVLFLRSPRTGWTVHAGLPVASLSVLQTGSVLLTAGGALASILLAGLLSWLLVRELRIRRRQEAALAESQHLEALGRLTGGVAHDFNNLLMIMQGGAEAIKRRRADPEQVAAYADGMASAAQRGAALTRQLLAYARKEAQTPRTFHLRDRADDLRVLLNQSTRPDIRTSLSIPDDAWPIYADPNAVEVALINLATNARDAMPDGGQLSVSAANASLRPGHDEGTGLAGDYVAVAVTDTGSGIADNHLARIFEPFFTTKPAGQGTGLGLSQVYGFARQSGGAVTVRSEVGKGTTFRLYLPRSAEAAQPAVTAARPPGEPAGGRVLLVEDNAEVARATEGMLTGAGYTVTAAGSAAAALDVLQRDGSFDVVLSDIVMDSGMSGLDLAARLRDRRRGPPIVLMTGYSEALANGANSGVRILAKPFSEADLVAALQAARHAAARQSDDTRRTKA
jgi:signal transduction histidine kinase/CheY-like chemotaxis protein